MGTEDSWRNAARKRRKRKQPFSTYILNLRRAHLCTPMAVLLCVREVVGLSRIWRCKIAFVTNKVYLASSEYLKEIVSETITPILWETLVSSSANLIVCIYYSYVKQENAGSRRKAPLLLGSMSRCPRELVFNQTLYFKVLTVDIVSVSVSAACWDRVAGLGAIDLQFLSWFSRFPASCGDGLGVWWVVCSHQ